MTSAWMDACRPVNKEVWVSRSRCDICVDGCMQACKQGGVDEHKLGENAQPVQQGYMESV